MKIIAANWKMNGSFEDVDSWLDYILEEGQSNRINLQNVEIVMCPPATMIDYVDGYLMEGGFENLEAIMKEQHREFNDFSQDELTEIVLSDRFINLGGQDCHFEQNGSFTGDISPEMLRRVGCEYVILGHSERRAGHLETSEIISKKVRAAIASNLTPIICVGESKEIRDQGKHLELVYKQIMLSVPQDIKFKKLVIAYEPIWAIGSGITPTAEQISEMAKLIKKIFTQKFPGLAESYFTLYGGSVSSKNSKEILSIPGIDGLLVGKASLDAEEFLRICLS